jgi:hypothetical protein
MYDATALGKRCLAFLGSILLVSNMSMANAATVEIRAAFKPSEGRGEFVDTTPPSGFCTQYGGCAEQIRSVAVPIEYDRTVLSGLPPLARRWSLHTPPQARVTLLSGTGEPLEVSFQVTHVAQVLSGSGINKNENPAMHSSTGGNCSFVAPYGGGGNSQGFIWRIADPISPGLCYPATAGTSAERDITVSAQSLSVGYRLITPQPYTLKEGIYQGSVTYSIGETGDFSLGSQVSQLSDSSLTFNFTLQVQHELSVEFPPGSDNITLGLPDYYAGGWHDYLSGALPAPYTLKTLMPVQISSSGPFNLTLRCPDIGAHRRCLIRDAARQTPVTTSIYFFPPHGALLDSQQIPQAQLVPDQTLHFTLAHRLMNVRGVLDIGVNPVDFRQYVLTTPGVKFTGEITLVFDAEL